MKAIKIILLTCLVAFAFDGINAIEIPGLEKKSELQFDDDFALVDEAFVLTGNRIDQSVYIRFEILDAYYLYKKRFKFSSNFKSKEIVLPGGLDHEDEYLGKSKIFRKHVEIELPIEDVSSDNLIVKVEFQGCADKGLCYVPTKRFLEFQTGSDEGLFSKKHDLSPELNKISIKPWKKLEKVQAAKEVEPVATKEQKKKPVEAVKASRESTQKVAFETEETRLQTLLENGSTWAVLIAFILAGMGLAFTPCVFPMVPILSSIISGQGSEITKKKAFLLSLVYVQAMAFTYALLGVLVALAGSSLAVKLQNPWIIGSVATLFVVLSLSMFGFYELQLPSALQNKLQKLNQNQQGGTYIGVAVMGVLSTLIVSPCTTAPLTGAMLYIASTEDLLFGGFALYALGVGMGIPLLLVGVSAGKFLPQAGSWMNQIKIFFGVSLLGMALYIARFLIQDQVYLLLWALLMICYAVQLGAFDKVESGWSVVRKGVAICLLLAGSTYIFGAAMGNSNPFKPIAISGIASGQASDQKAFVKVESLLDMYQKIDQANQRGQTVMIDFVADWCTACFEFADFTFPDPAVQLALKDTVLLKFDSTFETDEVNKVMKYYKVLGLPSILFIDQDGEEIEASRVTGFMDAEKFAKHVNAVFGR